MCPDRLASEQPWSAEDNASLNYDSFGPVVPKIARFDSSYTAIPRLWMSVSDMSCIKAFALLPHKRKAQNVLEHIVISPLVGWQV